MKQCISKIEQVARVGLMMGVVSSLMCLPVPLAAQTASDDTALVEQIPDKGEIDWTNGVIRANGFGYPPENVSNKRLAVRMSKRAARVVAYRNLLEIVQGIRIDSQTSVRNYMVKEDAIDTKVRGIIKGAQVIKEQEFPDTSVEVTVEMRLNVLRDRTVIPAPASQPKPIITTPKEVTSEYVIYTGLVVDAQGIPAQTALNPKILMEDGQIVYDPNWVVKQASDSDKAVGWARSVNAAMEHDRVKSKPLMVTALRADGSDYVISEADAQTLHLVPEHMAFLKQGKVLIVVDPAK